MEEFQIEDGIGTGWPARLVWVCLLLIPGLSFSHQRASIRSREITHGTSD